MLTTLLAVLILGTSLSMLVWAVSARFPKIARISALSFWCPFKNRNVTTEFCEDPWDGTAIDVQSCTAFEPATAIECDKRCLTLVRLPTPALADQRR